MLAKSLTVESDAVIYDLEDSVSPGQKQQARINVCQLLKEIRTGKQCTQMEVIVRINPFDSSFALEDLLQVCLHKPDAVIITKATAQIISAADAIITMIELCNNLPKQNIEIIALVETALGVETVSDIIGSSARLTAVQFGAEDFTRDMEIARTSTSNEIIYSRNRLAVACRAYGIGCIDTPYLDFNDFDGYEVDTRYAKSIGMTGRCVIHPALIERTNRIFSPTPQEVVEAKQIVAAFDEAIAKGLGAASFNGKMIDLPIMQRAKKLLEKAEV